MGDAAHAMVPHQGQGANQTIEDAIAARRPASPARAATSSRRRSPRYEDAPPPAHARGSSAGRAAPPT